MLLPNMKDADDLTIYQTITTLVPVIGVITQPRFEFNVSYFAASYAQYAGMAGARVVPVLCDHSKEELTELFGKLHGLIVPGAMLQSWGGISDVAPLLVYSLRSGRTAPYQSTRSKADSSTCP